jgi:hypothetical protein
MGIGEAVEQRQCSEAEDRNRAVAAYIIVDSDDKIYLTSLNK